MIRRGLVTAVDTTNLVASLTLDDGSTIMAGWVGGYPAAGNVVVVEAFSAASWVILGAIGARAWGSPWGELAIHQLTSAFSTSATHTTFQDEGLTVTVDETAERSARLVLAVNPYAPGGANGVEFQILRNGSQIALFSCPTEEISTGFTNSKTLIHTVTPTAAEAGVTYKVQVRAINNNTQVASYAGGGLARELSYNDIGPA